MHSSFCIRPHLLTCGLSLLVFAGVCSLAAPARADLQLGADLDYAFPLDSSEGSGGGFALRLGYQLHIPLAVFTAEAVFNYEGFSGDYGLSAYRGVGGIRLGIGEVFRPGAFVHVGIGHLTADEPSALTGTGLTYDAGLFFDFTLLPLLNLGVHAAYNKLPNGSDPSFQWLTFGAHAELIF